MTTVQPLVEYGYTAAARRRAGTLLIIEVGIAIVLAGVLALRWRELGGLGLVLGGLLLLILLFGAQAQLGKLKYRLQVWPDEMRLLGALGQRRLAWDRIEEVRRVRAPGMGANNRWACTVMARERSGRTLPTYLFDHQLEHADDALAQVVRRTPQAKHVNI